MPNKMERFTLSAWRVLSLAQDQAEIYHCNAIGTEHLLLGMMLEETGVASRTLHHLGLDHRRIQEVVERLSPPGQRIPGTRLDLSPEVKKILEAAVAEARRLGDHYIRTEHLLLGFFLVSEGIGIRVLKALNVTPEEVRGQTRRELLIDRPAIDEPLARQSAESLPKSHGKMPFTGRTETVLMLAREESNRMRDPYIGTEHLLLALMREGQGKAAKVLNSLMSFRSVDRAVAQLTESVSEREGGAKVEFSPDFEEALEYAAEEGHRSGHFSIGTDELLLGFLRVKTGVGIKILQILKVSPEEIRHSFEHFVPASPSVEEVSAALPSLVQHLTTNLLFQGKAARLDPVTGRDAEIERLIVILARLTNHNAILIGDAGVGKTTIVEGLAQRINSGHVPPDLHGKRLLQLDLSALVMNNKATSQTGYDDLVRQLLVELSKTPSILFLSDLLKYMTGSRTRYELHFDMLIKAASDEHQVSFIGEMLDAEYQQWQRNDPGLAGRFQPIYVKQPSAEETIAMLRGSKKSYEEHHGIEISDEALETAVSLAIGHITDRALPAAAFDVLDTAASQLRARSTSAPAASAEPADNLLRLTAEHIRETIAHWNASPPGFAGEAK